MTSVKIQEKIKNNVMARYCRTLKRLNTKKILILEWIDPISY